MNISTTRIPNIETPKTQGSAHSGAGSSWPDSPAAATDMAICWSSIFSPMFRNLRAAEPSAAFRVLVYVTALLPADLAFALDDPLRGGELGQAHGAAGVELLRGDAHLGTQAQLPAVGKPCGGVDDHGSGVNLGDEPLGVGEAVGEDRFRVSGGPGPDVLDGFVQAVHHGHSQVQVHVFGSPVH